MSRTLPALFALTALALGTFAAPPARAGDAPSAPAASAAKPVDLLNTTCPVTGAPVKPGITAVVNGAIVHFCCPHCPPKYQANPAAYASNLRADAAVAIRLDAAAAAMSSPGAVPTPPVASSPTSATSDGAKGVAFHDAMRALWSDHVTWTRMYIVSAVNDLADKDAVLARLLKNQDDLGNALKPYYGDEAGAKLTTLLKDHIGIAGELVTATTAADTAKVDATQTKWAANADEIATFLSGANAKAWPLETVKLMLREHLAATTAEVKARVEKDWDADIAAFENVRQQALKMADALSDGIRSQHPEKFK